MRAHPQWMGVSALQIYRTFNFNIANMEITIEMENNRRMRVCV